MKRTVKTFGSTHAAGIPAQRHPWLPSLAEKGTGQATRTTLPQEVNQLALLWYGWVRDAHVRMRSIKDGDVNATEVQMSPSDQPRQDFTKGQVDITSNLMAKTLCLLRCWRCTIRLHGRARRSQCRTGGIEGMRPAPLAAASVIKARTHGLSRLVLA